MRYLISYWFCVFSFIYSATDVIATTVEEAMGFEVANAWQVGAPTSSEYIELATSPKKGGLYSGKWSNHPLYPTMGTTYVNSDWSAYNMITFWVYSEYASNEEIFMAIHSDGVNVLPPYEMKDFYYASFKVDWIGWKKIEILFQDFNQYQEVAGWNKIDGISFYTKIFNRQPNPYTVLYFDEIRLVGCGELLLSDFNGDCQVDWSDLEIMLSQWLE